MVEYDEDAYWPQYMSLFGVTSKLHWDILSEVHEQKMSSIGPVMYAEELCLYSYIFYDIFKWLLILSPLSLLHCKVVGIAVCLVININNIHLSKV